MWVSCGFSGGWPKDYAYEGSPDPGEVRPYKKALSPAEAVASIGH